MMLCRMYSEGLGSIMLLLLADCVSSNFFLLSLLYIVLSELGVHASPPYFGRSNNPISAMGWGADYTPPPLEFSDLPTALLHEMKQSLLPLAFPGEFQSIPCQHSRQSYVMCTLYNDRQLKC